MTAGGASTTGASTTGASTTGASTAYASPEAVRWTLGQFPAAVRALAHAAGLTGDEITPSAVPPLGSRRDDAALGSWLEVAAGCLEIEVVEVEARYREVTQMLTRAGPMLLKVGGGVDGGVGEDDGAGVIAVLGGGRRTVRVVTPHHTIRHVRVEALAAVLVRPLRAQARGSIDALLREVDLSSAQGESIATAILDEQLAESRIGRCWWLRPRPGEELWAQVRRTSIPGYLAAIAGAHLVMVLLMLVSWAVIGDGGLGVQFLDASLWAWALLLVTAIPWALLDLWAQQVLAIEIGGLFRPRMLAGITRLAPEQIRRRGSGQLFGMVMEAEALGTVALEGGVLAGVAGIELVLGVVVLALGAGGLLHAGLLVGWLLLTAWLCAAYYRQARDWVGLYRALTHDLVERMVGYRTRLVQEEPERWHEEESEQLTHYARRSAALDRRGLWIQGLLVRGWLCVGLAGLAAPVLVASSLTAEIAIGLGGVLFVYQALTQLVSGVMSTMDAAVAWDQVRPLLDAAARPSPVPAGSERAGSERAGLERVGSEPVLVEAQASVRAPGVPVVEATALTFAYRAHSEHERERSLVLDRCSLTIESGDRILVEGPSGGGKSTLASLLCGLRQPASGQLRLWGIEQRAMGIEQWRRRVVSVPQFHENHVLTETLAFNLLMGRAWPPTPQDLQDAVEVCQELGLAGLLERMPAGLMQIVGESGWRLSHGECSRIFIARALLQDADLMVLDESFGALDPKTQALAMECVQRRARTLMVVAHP
ncbi:MAG: ABC transporter ATP-binding protein [Myxococcota bacterium]